MRRVLPYLLGVVGVVAFAAAGWGLASVIDGDDSPGDQASPPVEEERQATLQVPVVELVADDLEDPALDEPAAVVLTEPAPDVDPEELAPGSEGEVGEGAPDGSETPVPTRREAVAAAASASGDRVATVGEPRLTELPAADSDRSAWADVVGSDADPLPSEADGDAPPAWLDDVGVVEVEEEGAPLPPEDGDDRIIDLCAGPEPVEGCPDGVGGTVSLAVIGPFDILGVVATADDRCGIERHRDRFVATIRSSAPGRFHLRTGPAPARADTPWSEVVEVETAPDEVARWEEDETIVVQTCLALPLDRNDFTLAVQVLGNPLTGDGAGAGWTGEITPLHPLRPSVLFRAIPNRAGSNDTLAVVSSRADEAVEVVQIVREPGETTSACHRMEELRAAEHPGFETVPEWRQTTFPLPGTSEFPKVRAFELRGVPTQGADVCVTWYRDLHPEREVVERRAVQLHPPLRPSVTFRLSEVTTARGAPGPLSTVAFWLTDGSGRELCRGYVHDGDSTEVCRLDTTYAADTVAVHTQGYHDGGIGRRESRALELQQQLCRDGSCGGWTRLSTAGPDGAPGGSVRLDVRYANPPGGPVRSELAGVSSWTSLELGTFGGDSERGTGSEDAPRLDLVQTRIHYDQASDPFAIAVRWTADRPVTATVAGSAPSGSQCRGAREPGEVRRVRDSGSEPATSGEVVFEACPGVDHRFSIRLTQPGGGSSTFTSGGGPDLDAGDGTVHHWRDGGYTTPRLPVDVTYGARLRMGDWTGWVYEQPSERGQPSLSHVDWWTEVNGVRFSQSRRSGIIVHNSPTCTGLTDFDLAPGTITPTPVRMNAGATVGVRVDASYTFYSACRLIQTPASDPMATGGIVLIENVPLYDLLHDGPVTVMKRGTPSNRPSTSHCNRCVPHLYSDVAATVAPRG